jgi:hypothetical protein
MMQHASYVPAAAFSHCLYTAHGALLLQRLTSFRAFLTLIIGHSFTEPEATTFIFHHFS